MHLVVANTFSGHKAMLIQCVSSVCVSWLTVSQKFCCFCCKFPLLANHVEAILVPLAFILGRHGFSMFFWRILEFQPLL